MRWFGTLTFAILACACAEIAIPGRVLYHTGWFNVLVIVFAVLLGYAVRPLVKASTGRAQYGTLALALGALVIAFATVVSGLLAPDARTVVGAPGSEVALNDMSATLFFPVDPKAPVEIASAGHSASIGSWRYWGSSILQAVPRVVVGLDVRDKRGGTLTITQPSGSTFLSPVLLMQSEQTIVGMKIPFDTFAVPAMHRLVHVAAFSARQAAQMNVPVVRPEPAVIFSVDDDNDRPLPHGIALVQTDATASVGGMLLRGSVFEYPAIRVIAAPAMPAMAIGILAIVAGMVLTFPAFFKPALARDASP